MPEVIEIKDTPLIKATEEAKKDFEKQGYSVQVTGIEKCYVAGYQDVDTEMTDLSLVTCLDDQRRIYRVYSDLIRKAAKELDLKKPVWVVIFRLNTGLELVVDILGHTEQLESLFQQMKKTI